MIDGVLGPYESANGPDITRRPATSPGQPGAFELPSTEMRRLCPLGPKVSVNCARRTSKHWVTEEPYTFFVSP